MEPIESPEIVCDAGPLIHLDELECLDLLNDFAAIWVPNPVADEVEKHRPRVLRNPTVTLRQTPGQHTPASRLSTLARSLSLHRGELAALALMQDHPEAIFLTDDTAARLAAKSLGYRVHGTIGVLLRAFRVGKRTRSALVSILRTLPVRSTLHVRKELLDEVLANLNQAKRPDS